MKSKTLCTILIFSLVLVESVLSSSYTTRIYDVARANTIRGLILKNRKISYNDFSVSFSGETLAISPTGKFTLNLHKKDGEYAGDWTLDWANKFVRQRFITKDEIVYVIDLDASANDCHQETVQPMFEKLFEKMLILADEGEFFSGAMPSISSDTTDFTLTHASNGFNMDYYVKPLAKSAVIFNVKTLKINDEKVSVHLKNIKLSFNDANNVQELFKVPENCKNAPTQTKVFYDIIYKK